MAWRLDKVVEHGEIDNTVAGATTGRIWLRSMDEPLLLSLNGDCWRDIAGARLEFTNPTPQAAQDLASLDPDQVGLVGDMTAARRVRHPSNGGGPARWGNALYLEWFSEANGRVLIEATNFKLRISEHLWRMDEDDEEAQKLANLQAMRDFMARVIDRHGDARDRMQRRGGWDEVSRDSERASRAFGEVLEKYGSDPDSERKEAFVMGWDRKLEALADLDEALDGRGQHPGGGEDHDGDDEDDETWDQLMDLCGEHFGDGGDEFDGDEEPVVEKSRDLCLRAMDLIDQQAMPGTPAHKVISCLLEVSGKLTGAIDAGYDAPSEKGYVLTMLKRCLALVNEGIGALQLLITSEPDDEHRTALERLHAGVFEVREDITELHREIREEM